MAYKRGCGPLAPYYACGLAVHIQQYNGPDLFLCANAECVQGWSFPMHAHKQYMER